MNHCGVPGCVVCRGRQCGVPGCVVCDAGARETTAVNEIIIGTLIHRGHVIGIRPDRTWVCFECDGAIHREAPPPARDAEGPHRIVYLGQDLERLQTAERAVIEAALAASIYMGWNASPSSVWKEFMDATEALRAAQQSPPPRDAMSRSIADQIERGMEPRDD